MTLVSTLGLNTMLWVHYEQLAGQIAAEHGYEIDDVINDVLAVITQLRLDPTALTGRQVDRVRFEAIARTETVNHALAKPNEKRNPH